MFLLNCPCEFVPKPQMWELLRRFFMKNGSKSQREYKET
ncbi:hypothetical protein LEP1GSC040_0766 [Leptospira santarosai str. 2000030832]|nr:hypothetical protein LEP1GSC040_0766 [Leptospira santarosai str. 2000030832]